MLKRNSPITRKTVYFTTLLILIFSTLKDGTQLNAITRKYLEPDVMIRKVTKVALTEIYFLPEQTDPKHAYPYT